MLGDSRHHAVVNKSPHGMGDELLIVGEKCVDVEEIDRRKRIHGMPTPGLPAPL
jgi:hypothetical protein